MQTYTPVDMSLSGNTLSYELSGSLFGLSGLEYYMKIRVGSDSVFIGSSDNPYIFITSMTNAQARIPTAMPDAQYRIIGLPVNPTAHDPAAVFEDDLGAYDVRQWRLGSYDPAGDSIKEFPEAEQVYPGQGYWLIARGAKRYGSAGTSVRPNDSYGGNDYYRVPLEPGWNQLANPFPFGVEWMDILFDDNGTVSGHLSTILEDIAYWYTGSEYQQVDQISPWGGIFVFIKKSGITAMIPYDFPEALKKTRPIEMPLSSKDEWTIRIQFEKDGLVDDYNYAGVREKATIGIDDYDFSEPPPPPGAPRLAFGIADDPARLMRTDFRPPFSRGTTWELKLTEADGGKIYFSGVRDIPANMQAWLKIGSQATIRLSEGTAVPISEAKVDLKLIVGTAEYTSSEFSSIMPLRFNLCQNYPNPFNIETKIDFTLPVSGYANLKIFNLLGQAVRTLVDGERPAGHYTVQWDGNDQNGLPVASGVYFYRIEQGDQSQYKKMMLIK